jgi:hypothetical protein
VSIRKKRKTKKETKKTDDQEKPAHPVVVNEDKNSLFGMSIAVVIVDILHQLPLDNPESLLRKL